MNNYPNTQHTSAEIHSSSVPLTECLKNDISEYSRGVAALCLGQNRESSALLDLIESLSDESSWVRGWCVYALGRIQNPDALIHITYMLSDPDPWVRQQAAEALVYFDDDIVDTVLLNAIKRDDIVGKSWSLHVMAERGNPSFALDVIPMLEDEERPVRLSAIRALYRLGQSDAIAPLRMFMRDPDENLRGAAAYALGALYDRDSVSALSIALMDSKAWVRRNAAWSLLRLRENLRLVASMVNDVDEGVRMFARNASSLVEDLVVK